MNGPKNNLRKLRDTHKMSGVQVAEAANITPQYYYELERGDKRLNEDLIRRFADIFGCTTDHILSRTDDPHPPDPDIKDSPLAFMGNTNGINLEELEGVFIQGALHAVACKAVAFMDQDIGEFARGGIFNHLLKAGTLIRSARQGLVFVGF